jgi:molybdate/tungstate transport system substrate-binding protein
MKYYTLFLFLSLFVLAGCSNSNMVRKTEIIVFHAGSLSVPFNRLKAEYEKKRPGVKILLEPAGSIVCARKITELKKPCDIIASADYFVINELLIPQYTGWSIRFATNEIVIAYTDKSRYASEISGENWPDILLRDDVIYTRSDPDSDPCGYRAVFAIKLTEKLHGRAGLTDKLLTKDRDFIRPKEVDLLALVESNAADYMFQYRSVAVQHGLKYIELPDDVNLSDPAKSETYRTVSVDVTGREPGSVMKMSGDYINYSISVLDNAPDKDAAMDFLCFILGPEGIDIMRQSGQKPIIPVTSEQIEKLPEKVIRCVNPQKPNR